MDTTTKVVPDIKDKMMFRLLFGTQDDHYKSESAGASLRGLTGLDDESGRVTIKLWSMDAEVELRRSSN
jgi:hypothetical protein